MKKAMPTIAFAVICLLVVAAGVGWRLAFPPLGGTSRDPVITLAKLLDQVASDLSYDAGEGDGYRIVVIKQGSYPVGTLVDGKHPWIAVNFDDCKPAQPRASMSAPNMFPTGYRVKSDTAADVGLSSSIQERIKAKVSLKTSDSMDLSFQDVHLTVLAQDDLDKIVNTPGCRKAIADRQLMIVRGIISATRTFSLERSVFDRGSVDGKISNFSFDAGSGTSTVEVTDKSPQDFLEVISALTLPKTHGAAVQVDAPVSGLIYMQRDVADTSTNAATVLRKLTTEKFKVVPIVQAIESRKVPNTASVRYFNVSDTDQAEKVLQVLQQTFPDAQKTLLGLSSPPGQMEVWLPRVRL